MSINGADFLAAARRMIQGPAEADWRSAVSRCYYAVFHTVREFFLAHGLDIGSGPQAHYNLYIGLNNCGVPALIPIATRVNTLRYERVRADYELAITIRQGHAATWVNNADAIL